MESPVAPPHPKLLQRVLPQVIPFFNTPFCAPYAAPSQTSTVMRCFVGSLNVTLGRRHHSDAGTFALNNKTGYPLLVRPVPTLRSPPVLFSFKRQRRPRYCAPALLRARATARPRYCALPLCQ